MTSGRTPGAGTRRMVAALVRQRRRLALATVAIALAVGYLAGSLTLLDRVSEGLDDMAAASAERADLVVEGDVAYESALEQTRRLVPVSVGQMLPGVPGVAAVAPRVEEITMLLDADGVPLVAPGLSEQPIGANWPDDEAMSPYRFVGEGRPPIESDEIVIDAESARRLDVQVGDTVVAVARTLPSPYQVVGIVTTSEGELPQGSSLALFATEQARSLFEAFDNDNRVAIRLEEGVDLAEVTARIESMLPEGTELVDGPTAAEHRQVSLTRSFALVRSLIMGFAALALVVGMITVANSLTLLYSERRRTLAAFRLVGAKPHQLMVAALIEAAMLATVASIIGLPLGLAFGRFIEAILGALGTSIPVGGSAVSLSALATALVVGVLTTLLAAVVPARRACHVAPIEAVVEVPSDPFDTPGRRLLDGTVVALGAGVAIAGLLMLFDVDARIAIVAGAVAVGVVLAAALLPTALSGVVAAGISIVPLRPAALRRIGARDAIRNRSRTAATTGALMLATSVVAGLAVFLASFASAIDGDVDRLVTSDLVVDSATFTRGGLSSEMIEQIGDLEGVAAVSGWQIGRGYAGDQPVRITGIDGASLSDVLSPGWVRGEPETLETTSVLLAEDLAQQLGVGPGDMVPVTFHSGGVESLLVEGTYDSGSLLLGEAVVDRTTLSAQVPLSFDIAALVSLSQDTPEVRERVADLAKAFGVTSVLEPSEFVDTRSELLRGFERVIQWMLFFTVAQALVGVINTLLLSVGERRREFGLLRAAGAGRKQIHRLVLAEGLSFAVVGTLLGLAIGIVGGALGMRALERFGISGLDIPVVPLLATALLAVVLGVAAAVVPARWAAAVPPLEAVADAGVSGTTPRRRVRRTRRDRSSKVTPVPSWAPPVAAAGPRPGQVPVAPRMPAPPAQQPRVEPTVAPVAPTPAPVSPAPAQPAPVSPAPAQPAPVPPRPAQPAPVSPAPAQPAPVPPRPAQPAPAQPAPAQPAPAQPAAQPVGAAPTDRSAGWVRRAGEVDGEARPTESEPPRQIFAATPRPPTPTGRKDSSWRGPGRAAEGASAASIRLAPVLDRLDPHTVRDAQPALVPLARALERNEEIRALVQGWTKGLLCLVARTDRRLLVVVDRFPEPLVESLDPHDTGLLLFGPPGTDRLSVSVVDGHRLLELTGVRDRAEAAALQPAPSAAPRARATASEYF